MLIEDTENCSRKALVALLGISLSHFHTLKQAGVFVAVANGKYSLPQAIAAWAKYHADGRSGSDMAEEKKRLVIAQRRKLEQDHKIRGGELIARGEAEKTFNASMVLIAAQLDGLPGRVAGELAGVDDPAEVRAVLFDECRRIRYAAATKLEEWINGEGRGEPAGTAAAEDA